MKDDLLNFSLKKRAKTFYFASLFFSKEIHNDVKILYYFCRYIDDVGDSNLLTKENSKKQLKKIKHQIKSLKSNNQIISNFIKLLLKYNINISVPIELINGVLSDQSKVNIKTYDELIVYSFKVAGTVGLMMCSIMEVDDPKLKLKGITLGIAMQFTNIARDIKEDLEQKRIYFPKTQMSDRDSNFNEILINKSFQTGFAKNLKSFLDIADQIYEISWSGIIKLPLRYRIPIAIASFLYQSIGNKIRENNYDVCKNRIYLTKYEKILKTINILFRLIFYNKNEPVKSTEKKIIKILKKFESVYCD